MAEYDPSLGVHCLNTRLGQAGASCPIVEERSRMMAECEGLAPSEKLFDFLCQAIKERDELEHATKNKELRQRANLRGQVAALSYAVALIRNPYLPDVEAVLLEAEARVAVAD